MALDPQWRELFLYHLAETLNVKASAEFAGVGRTTAYEEYERSPAFAKAWEEAIRTAKEAAEGELYRRAVKGWNEPVYHKGERVGSVRKYSDQLLICLLKAHDPKYRADAQVQVNGDATKVYVTLSPEDL